jgi:hypothetical protein
VSLKRHKVVLVPDGIHVSGVPVVDSIAFFILGDSPSIVHTRGQTRSTIVAAVNVKEATSKSEVRS